MKKDWHASLDRIKKQSEFHWLDTICKTCVGTGIVDWAVFEKSPRVIVDYCADCKGTGYDGN